MKGHLIEITLTAEKPSCDVLKKLAPLNLKVRIFQINPSAGSTNHLMGIENYKKIRESIKDDKITIYENQRDKTWLETHSCEICRAVALSGSIITSVKILENLKVQYKILLKNKKALETLDQSIDGINYNYVESVTKLPEELTLRQKEVLYIAFKNGYFEFQRGINLDGLASELGISKKAVQSDLKRGIDKIVKEYIFNNI
ncbi:hypothetical protein FAD_0973 [Ferroplasma acidiphilum]|jgi:predicted DNA binding protein|uniref:HTH bat-type domain-containing protein n=2 Tax=Ferroplasma TaxID=74968 RepID=S0APA2_FERAC|nr:MULTISPECIES: helix-turn-helix domain-containing protein [Ferroplasma]AGO60024.1 hypothetical protein FACI_IFERC00001G0044 [Ferroplasma acidarmanus Fer1]ARD84855.1 hypothetical protein FAD_0973 [Ferroplasma acidiphilum]